jgi:hypothetical protein
MFVVWEKQMMMSPIISEKKGNSSFLISTIYAGNKSVANKRNVRL